MSSFSDQVSISIDGFTQNVIYYDLKLSQKMADHHHFSFLWQYTGNPVIEPQDQEKAFSRFIGNEVIFTFKVNDVRLMSKGKITRLDSIDYHGSPKGLHVTGTSHTIAIDDMKKSRVFLEKNLQQIVLEIFAEESSGEFYQRESIVPKLIKEFKSKTQYNQTSFDFLKRLSARYGEWFYFDGMRMQFGQIKNSKITLINESSIHNFRIEAHLVSHKTSYGGYDYNNATNIKSAAEKTTSGSQDRFATMVKFNQTSIVRQDLNNSFYTHNAGNKEEIDRMVELQTAGRDANSVFYSGTSYLPIGLGQMFIIQNKNVEHHLLAIEVIHQSEINGNYSCQFRAIPADVSAPHYTDVESFTVAETQSAIVLDYNDPEEMGRIKVQYYWSGWNNKSDWMRMAQQYSGTETGVYWRPEIGDEVIVSFEGGNIESPYISGSHYNGKAKPEFFDAENNIKGWKLRFGQLFKFVEKIGIWLSDPSGNELHMNEETKSTTLTAPETITINAKNIIIEATESITFRAGTHIHENVALNKTSIVGGFLNTSVGNDHSLHVVGDNHVNIEGESNSDVKKGRNVVTDSKIITQSESGHEFHTDKEIKNNSGEGTRYN